MSVEQQIREKIERDFAPSRLEIINESAKHSGHMGDNGTGESHFKLIVVSKTFENQSKIARHRAVNKCLADLLDHPIHALSLQLSTEKEITLYK